MKLFFLVALLTIFFPSQSLALDFQGRVMEVADGDSIKVMSKGDYYYIRLAYIDAPERGQPFSKKSKKYLSDLIFEKLIFIKAHGQDKFRRLVGEVFLEKKNINREMVRAGMAWEFKQYSEDRELASLQAMAKDAKRGIWSKNDPKPPWEYRKLNKK